MHTPEYRHSGYFSRCIERDRLRETIPQAVKILKKHKFDAIAFRGLSGALVGPLLAYLLKKTVIAVRKPADLHSSHGYYMVEGDTSAQKYVIVDDFICSGETAAVIIMEIFNTAPHAQCVGILSVDHPAPRFETVREVANNACFVRKLAADPRYQGIIS
jgi:adenine/guanine phosphoribosyltransferase-like PRPP-binding protein